MIRVYDALKNGYLLNKSIDLRSKTMTLDAAKDLLRHTGTVSPRQVLQMSNSILTQLNSDTEGAALLAQTRAKGWVVQSADYYDIQFKVTDGSTTASFKLNAASYNDPDNVTVPVEADGWCRYNIPSNVTLTSLVGAFNEKTNIDRIVLGGAIDTRSLIDMNRMCRYADNVKYLYINCDTSNVVNFERMLLQQRTTGDKLRSITLDAISNGANTTNMFIATTMLSSMNVNSIAESLDLSEAPLNLASAKNVLRALQTVTSETISFSDTTWAAILDNEEAVELLEAAYAKGWGSNEPDISIVANSGYDGVVKVNSVDKQLTQVGSTGVWIGSAGTVTALDYFLKHDSRSNYNSTSTNIRKVRFGKNINTASCTTMRSLCSCGGDSNSSALQKIDVRHLNTSNVTTLLVAFAGITTTVKENLIVGFEDWDVGKVSTFEYCFASYLQQTFDLHKWHVKSGANTNYMFPALTTCAARALTPLIYYTPAYWLAALPASDRPQLTVYPYHDITMAVDNASSQSIMVNESSVTAAYDSTLGIAYYDSSVPVTSLTDCTRTNTHIVSISFSKNMQIGSETVGLYRPFEQCTSLRTINWEIETSPGGYDTLFNGCTALTNIYGFDKFEERTFGNLYRAFSNTKLRYAAIPKMNFNTGIHYSFYGCADLIRISNFPGTANGINTTSAMYGCTSLTTIDSAGQISETISFSDCPLSLASAKVILNALQTVTSETISFSDTTWGYIAADDEAIELLEAAYAKGWGSNEPDISIVANSGYDGVVRVNGANKQLTQVGSTGVWIGSAGTVTALDYFLKHDSRANYNSTSVNIKKVRFGKNINTASCTDLQHAFATYTTTSIINSIDVRHLNTANVTNMEAGFSAGGGNVKLIGIENFDVVKVTTFGFCFNAIYKNEIFDLRNWHTLSNATVTGIFSTLSDCANSASNPVIYYTPGYWKAALPATDRLQLTVYPYHDITVAASSGFNGQAKINGSTVTFTQDSTLGIWYYDVPSGSQINSLNEAFYNNSTATSTINSIALSSNINFASGTSFRRTCLGLAALRSFSLEATPTDVETIDDMFNSNDLNGGSLCNVYGLENISFTGNGYCHYLFSSQPRLRYAVLPTFVSRQMENAFSNDTNLIRINRLPGFVGGTNTSNTFTGCTSLTTIDAAGELRETFSLADCPLSLASAKVILNALGTVSGKTLTFSTTTKGYINADSEALALVAAARNKGWTIAL